jgi:hypothetical protein
VRIYFGRSFENLLHARVRTSIHNDETLRAANRHRDLAKFERSSDLRDGRHKKMPGEISVVESTLMKLACGQGVLAESISGGLPSK